jgi:hypothetical protein
MRKTRLGMPGRPAAQASAFGHIRWNHGVRWAEGSSILRQYYGDSSAILRQMGPPSSRPLAGWMDGASTRPVASATGRASAPHLPPPLYFTMTFVRIHG